MNNLSFFFSSERIEKRKGFCDLSFFKLVNSIPVLVSLITLIGEMGFKYAGDTKSDSKAYTDINRKKICIGRTKSVSEACLSLAYESTNAKNAFLFKRDPKKIFIR